MKKFLMPFLLAVAILIPTAAVEAADVPDFRQVAGNYVTDGERVHSKKGYYVYAYSCSVDLRPNFAEQYVDLLQRSGLTYTGHDYKDFRRTSAQTVEKWFFSCRGRRVEFWQYNYFDEGRISFSVRVADGLTYAGY